MYVLFPSKELMHKHPIAVKGIDRRETKIEYKAKNISSLHSPCLLCVKNLKIDYLHHHQKQTKLWH